MQQLYMSLGMRTSVDTSLELNCALTALQAAIILLLSTLTIVNYIT